MPTHPAHPTAGTRSPPPFSSTSINSHTVWPTFGRQLCWSSGTLISDNPALKFNDDGVTRCACNDYSTSSFAALAHANPLNTEHAHAIYCPHVIEWHKTQPHTLSQRLAVFDHDGMYWPNHEWRFEVDEREMLPVSVYIWRAKPRFQCLQYKLMVTPMPEMEGKMWNVYWYFETPDTGLRVVHPGEDWGEDFHLGFYNDDEPLLELAKIAATQFIDIGLVFPCVKCGCVMDPEHFRTSPRGRWDAIYRGHFMETHRQVCPSCDESELIPWRNE